MFTLTNALYVIYLPILSYIDRKITPGLNKITWQSKNVIELFVRDCCGYCHDLHGIIHEFKEGKTTIFRTCKQISNSMLVRIDKNQAYEDGAFEKRQKEFRASICSIFEGFYQKIISVLKNIYKSFKDGPIEVQREWKSQINQVFA